MRIYKNNALPPQHLSKLHSCRKASKKGTKRQGPRSYYIKSNLSWNKHVGITANKANKVLGIIKRTVGTANQDIFLILYKSSVRPILEYAAPVWCPYLVKKHSRYRESSKKSVQTRLKLRSRRNVLRR